jgi:LmbE family N-acetylglucosaminyl deacetylase
MEINSLLSRPHVIVNISETYETALKALKNHKSQLDKADRFYVKFYDARTRLRGVQGSCERAEAFSIRIPFHAGPFYPENSVRKLV